MDLILIFIAIVVIFLVSYFIKKRLSPKTNWILSVIGFAALMALFFTKGFMNHIPTVELIILLICALVYCYYLYYRYKNLKNG